MLQQQTVDNHRFIVIKPFSTVNGTVPVGTEIVMFRGLVYCNGVLISQRYQQEIKAEILKAEEDYKQKGYSDCLKSFPFQPTAVY